MKAKLLITSVLISILAGCGSNKVFHKKHHSNRNWVKVESNLSEIPEQEATIAEVEKNEGRLVEKVTKKVADVMDAPAKIIDKIEAAQKDPVVNDMIKDKVPEHTIVTFPGNESGEEDLTLPATDVVNEQQRNHPESINENKESKASNTGQLLLLALLIVLIILAFTLLDRLLGGILGAVLIVFLILLLLRYFGVI